MIDILIYVAVALVVVVAALLAYAAAKPDTFRVQRATGINAPAERIFPLIANLKSMNTWNPATSSGFCNYINRLAGAWGCRFRTGTTQGTWVRPGYPPRRAAAGASNSP